MIKTNDKNYCPCVICNPKKDINKAKILMKTEIKFFKQSGWDNDAIGVLLCHTNQNFTCCIEYKVREHIEYLFEHINWLRGYLANNPELEANFKPYWVKSKKKSSR